MSAPLHILVVGAGGIAPYHTRELLVQPDVRVTLADADPARARALATKLGADLPVVDSLAAGLALRPDAALICTPPYLHAPMAREVLDAGVHAIVEKPPAASLAELDALIALAASRRLLLLPIVQVRVSSASYLLRALAEADLTGRFLHGTVETHWRRDMEYYSAPWRGRHATEIGGPWAGLAIHGLDMVLPHLPPVRSVQAHSATLNHPIEVEDCGAALLRCEGGGWFVYTVTTHAHAEQNTGRLVFEHCEVRYATSPYSYMEEPWTVVCVDPARQAQVDACRARIVEPPVPTGHSQSFHRQAQLWCAILRGGNPRGRDMASYRPTFELLTAIYAASKSGGAVALPITRDHPQYQRLAP
ncbi:MAG TPA: Gfo/Idh/MocA family oxidoreductase [Planctomycetota bacterium]|nr:Gfo/Idh/MocA family oxidoreductase [Planctomycetota bacterium]